MTKIIFNEDREKLNYVAANIIKDSVNKILEFKEYLVLAIPGGRSVPAIFDKLKEEDISWEKIHIFIVDERLVPIDHDDSNFKLAKESFIDSLVSSGKLSDSNVHPFIFDSSNDDSGIGSYSEELKNYGGVYDIVLLSSGEDGHIGALYPNHSSIEDGSDYFIKMDDSPKMPKDRMSMSRKLLLKSKVAIVLFFGDGKKNAYDMFLDEKIDYNSCPAKLVNSIEESYALIDVGEGVK